MLSKVTPTLVTDLGYKIFLMFATINIAGMGTFALLIPETKGRSLEEMDIIFGAVSADKRQADIAKQERGASLRSFPVARSRAHGVFGLAQRSSTTGTRRRRSGR